MKRTILFTIIYLFLISSGINAQTESDTVWTKNIWPLYVTDALFSPDGSKIYISCDNLDKTDRQVRIYDTETGDSLKVIKGITSIFAFSQDGKYKYSHDPTYKMDAETDEILYELNLDEISKDFKGIILRPPSFSPQSNMIFYSGYINLYQPEPNVLGLLIRLNAENLELIDFKIEDQYNSNNTHGIIDVSPDGKYFVTTFSHEDYKTELQLWDAHTFEKIKVLETRQTQDPGKPNYGTFTYFRFSPDSKMLGVVGSGKIDIWDINLLIKVSNIECITEDYGKVLEFSNDSKYLIWGPAGINKNGTKIAQILPCEEIYEYLYPVFSVSDIEVSPDSRMILSCSGQFIKMLNAHWTPSSVPEKTKIDDIQVFPNPSEDTIEINFNINDDNYIKIDLISFEGETENIYTGFVSFGENSFKINTSNLSSGNYLLRIQNGNQIITKKIIITK